MSTERHRVTQRDNPNGHCVSKAVVSSSLAVYMITIVYSRDLKSVDQVVHHPSREHWQCINRRPHRSTGEPHLLSYVQDLSPAGTRERARVAFLSPTFLSTDRYDLLLMLHGHFDWFLLSSPGDGRKHVALLILQSKNYKRRPLLLIGITSL